jgi:hypothetical protein
MTSVGGIAFLICAPFGTDEQAEIRTQTAKKVYETDELPGIATKIPISNAFTFSLNHGYSLYQQNATENGHCDA